MELKKHRDVKFIRAINEATISRTMTSFRMFTATDTPLDTVVHTYAHYQLSEKEMPAVLVTMESIPPRCRKPKREYIYLLLNAPGEAGIDYCLSCESPNLLDNHIDEDGFHDPDGRYVTLCQDCSVIQQDYVPKKEVAR